jgi:hypothetical protein
MKRDMELIRRILKRLEAGEEIDFGDHQEERANYHLLILMDAGFVDADLVYKYYSTVGNSFRFGPNKRLTMKGHDFLDAARDDEVWAEFLKVPRPCDGIFQVVEEVRERRELKAQYEKAKAKAGELIEKYGSGELVGAVAVDRESPAARTVDLPESWDGV